MCHSSICNNCMARITWLIPCVAVQKISLGDMIELIGYLILKKRLEVTTLVYCNSYDHAQPEMEPSKSMVLKVAETTPQQTNNTCNSMPCSIAVFSSAVRHMDQVKGLYTLPRDPGLRFFLLGDASGPWCLFAMHLHPEATSRYLFPFLA